jgi:hypothetical protein
LVNTRPDLAYVMGYVSRFLSEPHDDHMTTVKHILCYVVGMVNWDLHLRKGCGKVMLMGFSDSDFVSDVDRRKSTSGVLFFLNRSPISWQLIKQNVVAHSSCKAEYVAAANATC